METAMNSPSRSLRLFLTRWVPLLALAFAAFGASAQTDPPARVAALSHTEGSVAFAPAGETEWSDAVQNRPITRGDRLWTDPGARAELHLGSAALHLASQTFVEVMALDDDVLQLTLNEGTVNARVRQLEGGENFEVTTPQLAFRATQPGDYRVDVDPAAGYTRVTVRSGVAMVYGAGRGVLQLRGGQQMAFTGGDLATVAVPSPVEDAFDHWAADRNRAEDQSITARYVPREVVGYQQLDANGGWSQDPNYGAVWYPNITVADWAPYRYGRWEWIVPWGWTWIDDARWGFAPFHYGRWAHIGSRWAWVPGRIDRHPVYSPALVAFVGGAGANWNLSIASGPGIGWFPLAPGEAWRPTYRASTVYLRSANRNAVFTGNGGGGFFFQHRPEAITAVRVEDFNRGAPVHQHWSRVSGADVSRLQINSQPVLPQPRRYADTARAGQPRAQPRMQFVAPVAPSMSQRPAPRPQDEQRARQLPQAALQAPQRPPPMPPPAAGARRDQQAQQVQQIQRQRQEQQHEAVGRQQAAQQQERVQRQQQAAQQQERVQRQQQATQQQERTQRQQQAMQQQERVQRQQQAAQQQERVQRQQQAAQQQERVQRQQQAMQQQERVQRQQERLQQRAAPPQRQLPQAAAPQGRERGAHAERAAQGEDEAGRGRGRGRFN
jgi:DNA segregation ATPase FtsK/SpoIIIE-like protein